MTHSPDDAATAADSLPCAYGGPVCAVTFKQSPKDFVVTERLPFEADAEGHHWLALIEKEDTNTLDMLDGLARSVGVSRKTLGYSGLKDRYAITRQFVTLPAQTVSRAALEVAAGPGWRVVDMKLHRRKLRVGSHRENGFEITLRDIPRDPDVRTALERRLDHLMQEGMPNYFGPQRFGREGANVRKARQLFEGARSLPRQQHRFAVSAARSCLFNAVLAARVDDKTWNTLVPGEAVALQGSASWFPYDRLGDDDQKRFEAFDLHPSGPLTGAGPVPTEGDAAVLEQRVLAGFPLFVRGLEKLGLKQERRALRQPVKDLSYEFKEDVLVLKFVLAKGSFATSMLRELVSADGLHLPGVAGER